MKPFSKLFLYASFGLATLTMGCAEMNGGATGALARSFTSIVHAPHRPTSLASLVNPSRQKAMSRRHLRISLESPPALKVTRLMPVLHGFLAMLLMANG